MRTMVRKDRRGIDCSFAVPPPERLLELGYDFVLRYLSVPPSSPAKNWTRAQIEMYREAGIDVGAVWEMSAARPNLGATYGEIDGRSARLEARKLDWPDDIELLTACDLNSFADNIDRHEMYVRGFHKTNEHEWIGLYGDTDILARTAGIWNIGWVPIGAWAWSGTSYADAILRAKAVGAHVLQSKGYFIDDVWAVDPNDVINDFPLWASKTATPPPPFPPPIPQPEDDMITINDICKAEENPGDKFVLMLNGRLRPIGQVELRLLGIPLTLELGKPVSAADRATLGEYTDSAAGTVDQTARDMAARNADALSDVRMGGERIASAGGH